MLNVHNCRSPYRALKPESFVVFRHAIWFRHCATLAAEHLASESRERFVSRRGSRQGDAGAF